nr:nucleocapsid protein [Bamboo rat coronavirus]WEY18164.1 MAG: nucleocapsid protein [Bamboo rat coronavirus]
MSFIPGLQNAGSRSSSGNRSGNGILKKTSWAEQTERNQSNSNRGRRTQPKQTASSQQQGSVVPHYSWFSGITQFQKGKEFHFNDGQGVPIANGIPATEAKGYWYRHNRRSFKTADGQQKQLLPRWYFYYLGSGPYASANYGDDIEGVFWVASNQADTATPSDVAERDPSSHEAFPTRFAPGTVLPQGYYVEGSGRSAPNSQPGSRSQSRGPNRANSRSTSNQRQSASVVKPDMAEEIASLVLAKLGKDPSKPHQVTKQNAKEVRQKILNKPRQKRTPSKQCNVQQCFGKRGPNQNFGNPEMLKLGTSDPQFPILAELAPTPGAFFFGSKLELAKRDFGESDEPTKDVYELRYSGAIRFDSTLPGFETIMKVLNENLNAYQNHQAGSVDVVSPKPQRKRGTKQMAQHVNDNVDNVSVAKPKSAVQRNVIRELTPEDHSLLAKLDEPYVDDSTV